MEVLITSRQIIKYRMFIAVDCFLLVKRVGFALSCSNGLPFYIPLKKPVSLRTARAR